MLEDFMNVCLRLHACLSEFIFDLRLKAVWLIHILLLTLSHTHNLRSLNLTSPCANGFV